MVLHLGWGNPQYQEWIESRRVEKDLVILVDDKLDMRRQCRLQLRELIVSWAALKEIYTTG